MKIGIVFENLLAVVLTLAMSTAGHAQALDKAKLDQLFDRLLEKNKGMGSVAIAKDGNVVYTRSFGYSQINGAVVKPATVETKYRIASITKMYTAVMIFQLVGKEN
jgi:CubicO group peptidase (beta-lactamase class C family)